LRLDERPLRPEREQDRPTTTRMRALNDRAHTHEVAGTLSGAKVTDTSLQHAAQIITAIC